VLAQGDNRVLATEPHTLDVDGLSEIPDLLRGVKSVSVVSVHDTSIVEHDINTTPGIEMLD
jgi:hypothetical protein